MNKKQKKLQKTKKQQHKNSKMWDSNQHNKSPTGVHNGGDFRFTLRPSVC